jgi:hypothetical protein
MLTVESGPSDRHPWKRTGTGLAAGRGQAGCAHRPMRQEAVGAVVMDRHKAAAADGSDSDRSRNTPTRLKAGVRPQREHRAMRRVSQPNPNLKPRGRLAMKCPTMMGTWMGMGRIFFGRWRWHFTGECSSSASESHLLSVGATHQTVLSREGHCRALRPTPSGSGQCSEEQAT